MRPALIVLLSFSGLLAAAAPARAGGSLNGTWSGSETLGGYGRLTFRFSGGSVQMIDAKDVVNGSYSHSGGQVTLSFYNNSVIYRGTVSGNSMSGSATNGRVNWSWSVSHAGGGFGGGQPVPRGPSAEERARIEARRRAQEQARQAAARRAREQARQQAQEKAREKARQQAREQARQKAQQQAREQARKKVQEQARQQQLQRERQQARKPARPTTPKTHHQPATQLAKQKPRQPSRQPGNQLARQPARQKNRPQARPPVHTQVGQQAKRPPRLPARPPAQLAGQQARPQAPLTQRPTLQGSYTPAQPVPQPASPTPADLAAQAARQKTGQMLDQLTTLLSNNWVDPGPYITGDTDSSSSSKSGDLYSVEYYRQGSKVGELYGMYSSKAAADKAKKEVEKWAATITDPDWKIGKIAVEKVGGSSGAGPGGKTGVTYQDDAPKRQADAAPRATATPRPGESERAGEKGKLPPALERLKDGVELGDRFAAASERSLELLKKTLEGRARFLEKAIAGARANVRGGGSAAQRFLRAAEAELGAVRNELRTFEKAERLVKQVAPALETASWGIWLGETLRATRSAPAGEKLNTFLEKSMAKVAGELTKELIVGAFVAETAGLGLLELPAAVAVASVAGDLVEYGVERFLRWRRGAKAEE